MVPLTFPPEMVCDDKRLSMDYFLNENGTFRAEIVKLVQECGASIPHCVLPYSVTVFAGFELYKEHRDWLAANCRSVWMPWVYEFKNVILFADQADAAMFRLFML